MSIEEAVKKEQEINKAHKGYLSFSGGKARIIYQGSPICADTTFEQAKLAAKQMKVTLAAEAWNGDRAEWVWLDTIEGI